MTAASPLKNASSSVADFLVALMKIESTTKNEGALAFAIKEYLKSTGWSIINQPMPEEPARSNILATRSSKNCGKRANVPSNEVNATSCVTQRLELFPTNTLDSPMDRGSGGLSQGLENGGG